MVSTGTNALDMNVSGNRISIEIPCTAEALLISTPISAKIQLTANEHPITSRPAPTTPRNPPPGR